jgi:hypothetical protein
MGASEADLNTWLWAFMVVAGPILLGLALWWAIRRTRKRGLHAAPGTELPETSPDSANPNARPRRRNF